MSGDFKITTSQRFYYILLANSRETLYGFVQHVGFFLLGSNQTLFLLAVKIGDFFLYV